MTLIWTIALLLAGPADDVQAAEALAAEAVAQAAASPVSAMAKARRALARTENFEPTAFVVPGSKGEVVEDAYLAARQAYRRHRAKLYGAVGECLARAGRPLEASRYVRRSLDLDADPARVEVYARILLALGRHREVIDVLLGGGFFSANALALIGQAADALGLPCVQCEIDRARLSAAAVEPRPAVWKSPLRFPEGTRLSTGASFTLEGRGLTLVYVAEPSCRTCSADFEVISRTASRDVTVFVVPAVPSEDIALRRVLRLYRHEWQFLQGPAIAKRLGIPAPSLLAVARGGWSTVLLRPPLTDVVPVVLGILGRQDIAETLPRSAWNGRPPRADPIPERPMLLPEGLAPGEGEPFPSTFVEAVAAFRAGRFAEALRLFESLEQAGDGWLLPPEARLDRAYCLAGLNRREEARKLVLRTGDSRFQEAVDRALDTLGSGGRSPDR